MPEWLPSPRLYTPRMLGAELGISGRWASKLCRRTLGRRTRYRLTEAERSRVVTEYLRWRLAPAAENEAAARADEKTSSVSVRFGASPSFGLDITDSIEDNED